MNISLARQPLFPYSKRDCAIIGAGARDYMNIGTQSMDFPRIVPGRAGVMGRRGGVEMYASSRYCKVFSVTARS